MNNTKCITVAESKVTIEVLDNICVDVDAVVIHTNLECDHKTIIQFAIDSLINYFRIRNIVSRKNLKCEEWYDSETQTKNLLLTDYQYMFSFIH
jgi:hypothetical protein